MGPYTMPDWGAARLRQAKYEGPSAPSVCRDPTQVYIWTQRAASSSDRPGCAFQHIHDFLFAVNGVLAPAATLLGNKALRFSARAIRLIIALRQGANPARPTVHYENVVMCIIKRCGANPAPAHIAAMKRDCDALWHGANPAPAHSASMKWVVKRKFMRCGTAQTLPRPTARQ